MEVKNTDGKAAQAWRFTKMGKQLLLVNEHGGRISYMDADIADDKQALIAAAPRMYQWLTAHYAVEEGPGKTDRPEYAELREILKSISEAA